MNIRNYIIWLACGILVAIGCQRKGHVDGDGDAVPGVTLIEGIFKEGPGREVILEEMAAREYIPLDTVTCDEHGTFLISFTPERTAFYVLRTGGPGYITLLVEPGEQLRLEGTYGNTREYRVEGSPGSELLMELGMEHARTLDTLARITRKNMALRGDPRYAEMKARLDREFDSVTGSFQDYSLGFIHRNNGSLAILIALYNLYGQGLPVFHPRDDQEVYLFVDSALNDRYGDYEVVRLLHAQLLEAEASRERDKGLPGPQIGEIAPDFVSSGPGGEPMALADLRGNYVLLSFWAGWSMPSRKENRYLAEAWDHYGQQSFRILQVSLDEERERWINAIAEEGLTWDHVSELRRWNSRVADLYRVEKIPSNYLIGPGGEIIARDLFGKDLLIRLEVIFGK